MSVAQELDYSRERMLQARVWDLEAENKRLRAVLAELQVSQLCANKRNVTNA